MHILLHLDNIIKYNVLHYLIGIVISVVIDVAPDSPDFLLVLDAKTFKELGRAIVPPNVHLPPTVHGLFVKE